VCDPFRVVMWFVGGGRFPGALPPASLPAPLSGRLDFAHLRTEGGAPFQPWPGPGPPPIPAASPGAGIGRLFGAAEASACAASSENLTGLLIS
jgi:hypothetical protein